MLFTSNKIEYYFSSILFYTEKLHNRLIDVLFEKRRKWKSLEQKEPERTKWNQRKKIENDLKKNTIFLFEKKFLEKLIYKIKFPKFKTVTN